MLKANAILLISCILSFTLLVSHAYTIPVIPISLILEGKFEASGSSQSFLICFNDKHQWYSEVSSGDRSYSNGETAFSWNVDSDGVTVTNVKKYNILNIIRRYPNDLNYVSRSVVVNSGVLLGILRVSCNDRWPLYKIYNTIVCNNEFEAGGIDGLNGIDTIDISYNNILEIKYGKRDGIVRKQVMFSNPNKDDKLYSHVIDKVTINCYVHKRNAIEDVDNSKVSVCDDIVIESILKAKQSIKK